jgi:NAD(P)-dependent dehydrogenase (short-subunit alcohol dehydrogenase family)
MSGPKTPSLIDMKSKRVIITGATSGLGKESAIALAKANSLSVYINQHPPDLSFLFTPNTG